MLALDRTAESIRADLARVLARFPGSFELSELEAKASDGLIQVFPLAHSSIVGSIVEGGQRAHLIAGAGNMGEILAYEPELCRFYFRRGCLALTLKGRLGWRRALRPLGWMPGPAEDEVSKSRLEWFMRREASASDMEGIFGRE